MSTNVSSSSSAKQIDLGKYIQLRRLGAGIIDIALISYIQWWVDNVFGYMPDTHSSHDVVYGVGWGYGASFVPVVDHIWLVAIVVAYFFVQEALFSTTLGKATMGLQVVDIHGRPISIKAALIRNLARLIDAWPGLYIVGIIAARFSPNYQRLGDRWAKTYVVMGGKQMFARFSLELVWWRLALIGALIATMIAGGLGFAYTRQPVLVIQDWNLVSNNGIYTPVTPVPACGVADKSYGDNIVLNVKVDYYWLKDPQWGDGMVTYPVMY
ncbi:hypothetical protein KDA_45010 [Dictyobacter alpinus]|uniref:RDD domain-containing protein n=1 Tax=Dictyobacter alpinus TaxID=2014873 RepID=A0A402BCK4_9CHLR|nr:RDD family protein [Dictyobacter alpinus]GCE29017.1 hypothetical protein KDA_45010 [Dictyobacter alpinus]